MFRQLNIQTVSDNWTFCLVIFDFSLLNNSNPTYYITLLACCNYELIVVDVCRLLATLDLATPTSFLSMLYGTPNATIIEKAK